MLWIVRSGFLITGVSGVHSQCQPGQYAHFSFFILNAAADPRIQAPFRASGLRGLSQRLYGIILIEGDYASDVSVEHWRCTHLSQTAVTKRLRARHAPTNEE